MNLELYSGYNDDEQCWEVSVAGEIDIFTSDELRKRLSALITEKNADVVLDCKKLQYIDSTALGVLVEISQRTGLYGGRMILKNVGRSVAKLLKITNLDKVFMVVYGLEKADAETENANIGNAKAGVAKTGTKKTGNTKIGIEGEAK